MNQLQKWQEEGDYFDFHGHKIFFKTTAGSDENLICLHGFPASSYDYHKIWRALSERFAATTFDLIGYGFSDKPPALSYTTSDQADVFEALIKHTGIRRTHILAHDYGNTITLELFARMAEGRLDLQVDSVCFLNGALFPETHRPIMAQRLLAGPLGGLFGSLIPDSIFRKSLSSVFGPQTQPSAEELDCFVKLFKRNGGKRISHKLIRYMSERTTYRDRWLKSLKEISVPFRMINGSEDPVSGRHLISRFREIVPEKPDIVELKGIGHFPHFEDPFSVIRHLDEYYERQNRGENA